MSALVILVTGIWNRPAETFITDYNFIQSNETTWQLSANIHSSIGQNQRVFAIYQGATNLESGNDLQKVYGTVGENNVVKWDEITFSEKPELNDKSVYIDYVGATLTAAAFDKVVPGLGKWLVTFASWLFAISTMISWSYYGEKGVVFLFGNRGIILYKIAFCVLAVLATSGFIRTDAELNMFANLGTGFCIIANLPIIWLFGHQAMKEYKDYIKKLNAGEFIKNN